MTEIPLFPLSAVLVPGGRMPLQIFERRYIDLVRDCLRNDKGFGIVWIREGDEVAQPGHSEPEIGDVGCYARIVDWDQLPNGLLGVTVEGSQKFELESAGTADNGLVMGEVNWLAAPESVPMASEFDKLLDVLRSLETHPHVQRLNLTIDYDSAFEVGYALVQLLPLEESLKFELLCLDDAAELMRELDVILNQLSGQDA